MVGVMRRRWLRLGAVFLVVFSFPLVWAGEARAADFDRFSWGTCDDGQQGSWCDVDGDGDGDVCAPASNGVVLTPQSALGGTVARSGVQLAAGSGLKLCGGVECIGAAMLAVYAAKTGWEMIWDWALEGMEGLPWGTGNSSGTVFNECANVGVPSMGSNIQNPITVTAFAHSVGQPATGSCAFRYGLDVIAKDPATGRLWRCFSNSGPSGVSTPKVGETIQIAMLGAGRACMAGPGGAQSTLVYQYVKVSRYDSGPTYGNGAIAADSVRETGTVPPTPRQFRAETSCTYQSGSNPQLLSRENWDAPKVVGCAVRVGDPLTGGMVTIKTRVAVNDAYVTIDSYSLAPSDQTANATQFPQCYEVKDGQQTNVCATAIRVDGELCQPAYDYPSSHPCYDWTRIRQQDPERVKCYMGPYVMPASHCNFLERAHQGIVIPSRTADIDGNPDTWTAPGVQPKPQPNPYPTASPTVTVTQSPTATSDPSSTVSQSPTVTNTAPPNPTPTGPIPGGEGAPNPTDTEANECWPRGWGVFNPAEWVLRPTKCALSWAFVPKGNFFQDWWGHNKGTMGGSPLGQWWNGFGAWGNAFSFSGTPTGCQGPAVSTGFLSKPYDGFGRSALPPIIYPFEACTGVKRTVAETSKMILSVFIAWGTGWRLVRIVGAPFGYSIDLIDKAGGSPR